MEDGLCSPDGQIVRQNVAEDNKLGLDPVPTQPLLMEVLNVKEKLRKVRNVT